MFDACPLTTNGPAKVNVFLIPLFITLLAQVFFSFNSCSVLAALSVNILKLLLESTPNVYQVLYALV